MKRLSVIITLALIACWGISCSNKRKGKPRVLVFTKTAGYHHAAIPDGAAAIMKLGQENGFSVDTTSNAAMFTEDTLKKYSAIVFMSTTGEVLNNYQQADFERYIEAGGGYVGVHAATDGGYTWPWYKRLSGAYFKEHPAIQQATLDVVDHTFPGTKDLPDKWVRTDEWYNFRDLDSNLHVVVKIDESSYQGGTMGKEHPMVWYHDYDGGRAFYMELGHTKESYTEPKFLQLLEGGIQYAIGNNKVLDYSKATAMRVPAEDRFTQHVLSGGPFTEPTEMSILPNLDIIVVERRGQILFYNHKTDSISQVGKLNVYWKTDVPNVNVEMGLLGVKADPHYDKNNWVYFYYSPVGKSVDRLSRFKFVDGQFKPSTEQVILEVPTERAMCCHTGGSIAFDSHDNLFVSVGDNTTPFDETDSVTGKAYPLNSHGYAPLDDRPGFDHFDDRRSSGNSNDLRGKILRIKVNEDGSYSIPEGNLYPKGTPKTRPEIYVQGDRNPYRISVDQKTGFLYWGEVGPDANNDSLATHGPRGYDEINQAQKAGNFGWPYFVGNNYPYREYNYATGQAGQAFDPQHPVNDSRNNTGLRDLPPAQPAFIWYPYAKSPDFPKVGTGGRCAMAGPVYYSDLYPEKTRFPDYYNGKLFIYDWVRDWIMAVTMDKNGHYVKMEPFMPHSKWVAPEDMEMGPDGRIYVLDYGSGWFATNSDAALIRIDYNSGNRPPQATLQVDKLAGALPYKVHLSAQGTMDPDGDKISYSWNLGNGVTKETNAPELDYSYNKIGDYKVYVTAKDSKGDTGRSRMINLYAGNSIPDVQINLNGNHSFYFPDVPVKYAVAVSDKEDGSTQSGGIDNNNIKVQASYLKGHDKAAIKASFMEATPVNPGHVLMESLDCKACHKMNEKSIGPAFMKVAMRYQHNKKAMSFLPNKIIKGGSGNWGEQAMSAHPDLSKADAREIVSWILTLSKSAENTMPAKGSLLPARKFDLDNNGSIVLQASYTDKGGNNIKAMTGKTVRILSNPSITAPSAADSKNFSTADVGDNSIEALTADNGWLQYKAIDLSDVNDIEVKYGVQNKMDSGWKVEVHEDSPTGKLVGNTVVGENVAPKKPASVKININHADNEQPHDLYFVFSKADAKEQGAIGLMTFIFQAK